MSDQALILRGRVFGKRRRPKVIINIKYDEFRRKPLRPRPEYPGKREGLAPKSKET